MINNNDLIISWFSCGITSTIACKIALEKYCNVELYYIEIDSAHLDNNRFISDCEKWFNKKINRIRSTKFKDQFEVIEKTGYVNGVQGARCTKELKKNVRFELEQRLKPDLFDSNKGKILNQVYGFEFNVKQIKRAIDFGIDFKNINPLFPLIELKLTKENCAQIILNAGIELPNMYKLGYNNNNCIGCVKGGRGYWNKVRIDFPEYFKKMSLAERKSGHSCINGIFLDELSHLDGNKLKPIVPNCSVICEDIFAKEINLSLAKQVFSGQISIYDAIKNK